MIEDKDSFFQISDRDMEAGGAVMARSSASLDGSIEFFRPSSCCKKFLPNFMQHMNKNYYVQFFIAGVNAFIALSNVVLFTSFLLKKPKSESYETALWSSFYSNVTITTLAFFQILMLYRFYKTHRNNHYRIKDRLGFLNCVPTLLVFAMNAASAYFAFRLRRVGATHETSEGVLYLSIHTGIAGVQVMINFLVMLLLTRMYKIYDQNIFCDIDVAAAGSVASIDFDGPLSVSAGQIQEGSPLLPDASQPWYLFATKLQPR